MAAKNPWYKKAVSFTKATVDDEKIGINVPKDYSKWYWKFIPHHRAVDDEKDYAEEYEDEDQFIDYEYRDEADRSWWRNLFNEYEYRFPTKTIQKKKWWRWFDEGTSAKEKALVCKLDLLIVTFTIISYWAKYVDTANVANAYVSGMKEDLGMKGNDYSNTTALYNAGCVIFQVGYMYLFPRVPMHYMFCIADICWSGVTLAMAASQNPGHLKVCRFFVGSFEAGYFIMIHYLLGSWYKPDELGRRGGLFYTGQMIGYITSGLLQAAIYSSMNGYRGIAGWRWMFIIDGIITIPIGLTALWLVPGTPYKCHSLFLTDDEIRLARKRLRDARITPPSKNPPPFLDTKIWKRVLASWKIYVLMIMDALFWNTSTTTGNGFALWLKSLNTYTTPELNRQTSIPPAIGVGTIIACCFSADFLRSRGFAIFWAESVNFTCAVILAIWNVPIGAKWFAFYLGYMNITISSVVYGWVNDIMRHDPQERAIVLCWCNIFSNQSTAWIGALTYPTSEGPRFRRGYTYTSAVSGTLMIWVWLVEFFYKRQERRDSKENGIILYNSKTGDIPDEVAEHLAKVNHDKPYSENDPSSALEKETTKVTKVAHVASSSEVESDSN